MRAILNPLATLIYFVALIAAARAQDWPTYRHDTSRTGTQPQASALSDPKKVSNLQVGWSFPTDTQLQTVVLGSDNNLWLEHGPFGKVPPKREQIDGNAQAFQALDSQTVIVLGSDKNLWLEHGPFGKVPPKREQIDGNAQAFQTLDSQTVIVLGSDKNLWLAHAPFGQVPPKREQIDGNAQAFQALDSQTVIVLGSDKNLWLAHGPFSKVPPKREQIDSNAQAFQALDSQTVIVLGSDKNLWLEHAPFGQVPPKREQIDGNAQAFQALAAFGPFNASSIVVNDTVFVGNDNGYFYVLDAATAKLKWQFPLASDPPLRALNWTYGIQSPAAYWDRTRTAP